MKVAGERFTVIGAGRSGRAAATLLAQRGADVRLVDGRADATPPATLHPAVAFEAGTNGVRPGDVAVLSPGITEVSPVRAQVAAVASEVIGEVELFYRLCPAPVLAITGTDGKSTVTTMLGAITRAAGRDTFVGGNLGNPLCEALDQGADELTPSSVVVAEISAFQLTTCDQFRPRVAIVTNIAEDHLDYHGGFQPYQAAKRRIWAAMGAGDVLVLNADDPIIRAWPLPDGPTIRWFSTVGRDGVDARFDPDDGRLLVKPAPGASLELLMTRDELPLLGSHNVANALASALAAAAFEVPLAAARAALMVYEPLAHRLQPVATVAGVAWVNDSKATNPNAAAAGIRAIDGPLIVLAGGSSKDSDFAEIGGLIRDRARSAIVFGATRDQLAAAIGPEHPTTVVETMQEAVALAAREARPGDTVLLGPACASFDQFRSYGHRGEVFMELVRGLR